MRTRTLLGMKIRIEKVDGTNYAILEDVCNALALTQGEVIKILDVDLRATRVKVNTEQGCVYMTAIDDKNVDDLLYYLF